MSLMLSSTRLKQRRYQLGVNLIEIMVAMTIGLLLVLGATTLYVNSKKTSDADDEIARLNETARYAMSIIESDVRMANYWGLRKDGSDFVNGTTASTLEASSGYFCSTGFATSVAQYIEASNNKYPSSSGGRLSNCTAKYSASPSADTLTIRRASSEIKTSNSNYLQICSTRGSSKIIKGDTCTNGEIHNLVTNTYYIDNQSDQDQPTDIKTPSLRVKKLVSGSTFEDTEVIPGVEDMQIELGWDNGNGSRDTSGVVAYKNPEDATLPNGRIIAVRVWLLIRSEKPDYVFTDTRTYSYADRTLTTETNNLFATAGIQKKYKPNDHYHRLLVSKTIFIRNVTEFTPST